MSTSDTDLKHFIINKLTKAQYNSAEINDDELYFIIDGEINADEVDDTTSTHKFVTNNEKSSWNAKSEVSGTNDGTNWTSITIDGTTKAIPSGGGGGGTATDVQINGTSITSNNVANIVTETAYDSTTNKIATVADLPNVSNMQTTGNLVDSISSSSTDTQYPSAKCMYDMIGDVETLLGGLL